MERNREAAEVTALCGAFSGLIYELSAEYERMWQQCAQERGALEEQCGRSVDAAYVVQLCGEFSRVLWDVTAEHERVCAQWEQRCAALELRCQRLEADRPGARMRLGGLPSAIARCVKQIGLTAMRTVFHWGRTAVGRLGIKERLKQSRLFRRLYLRGTIDQLRK